MKEVLMMILPDCPSCILADRYLAELKEEDRAYGRVPILRVDESVHREFAESLDYYYVPAFFVGEKKLLEGVPTRQMIRAVLDAAMEEA